MISVKPFKQEKQWSNLYTKQETGNTYEPHQQTTTTKHQIPDLKQMQTMQGFKGLNRYQSSPLPETMV